MNKAYENMAKYYDYLQREMDYTIWQEWLIKEIGNKDINILEVGCGTGRIANFLYLNGISIDAFDLSPKMIEIARLQNENINFYVDDALSFKVKNKYNMIICFMDTVNYLNDIEKFFKQASLALNKNGILLFDVHREDNVELFDNYTESGYIKDTEYIWKSTVFKNTMTHEFTFREKGNENKEVHKQYIYTLKNIKQVSKKYFNVEEVTTDDYRHYFKLKKRG